MNLLPILGAGAALYFMQKGKKDDPDTVFESGTGNLPPGTEPVTTGDAKIMTKRLWINRILDYVKFRVLFPNGQTVELKNKLKRGNLQQRFGDYWVVTEIEPYPTGKVKNGVPEIDETGAVNIAVLNRDKSRVLSAIRVIMPTKNVIDVR